MTEPDPGPGVVAHLNVDGGEKAIAFYARAFGAEELYRHMAEDGLRVMHTTLAINGGNIMLHDHFPEFCGDVKPPTELEGCSVTLHIQFADAAAADAAFAKAVEAGCKVEFAIADQFWGDRYGKVRDPFGHIWSIGGPIARQS